MYQFHIVRPITDKVADTKHSPVTLQAWPTLIQYTNPLLNVMIFHADFTLDVIKTNNKLCHVIIRTRLHVYVELTIDMRNLITISKQF